MIVPPKVFVSYSRRGGYVVGRDLATIDLQVSTWGAPFIDLLHNGGHRPQGRVIEAVCSADVVLLLETPGVLGSPWVTLELSIARSLCTPVLAVPWPPTQAPRWYPGRVDLGGLGQGRAIAHRERTALAKLRRLTAHGEAVSDAVFESLHHRNRWIA